jgi:hypothetical protein
MSCITVSVFAHRSDVESTYRTIWRVFLQELHYRWSKHCRYNNPDSVPITSPVALPCGEWMI